MKVGYVLGTTDGGTGRHVRMLAGGVPGACVFGPAAVGAAFGFGSFRAVEFTDRPRPVRDLAAVRRLRRLLRAGGFDVVHAHGMRAGALTALALLGDRRRPGLVVTVHNAPAGGGVAGMVYRGLELVVARRADSVLCVSADLEQRMRAAGARRVGRAVVPAVAAAYRDGIGNTGGQFPASARSGGLVAACRAAVADLTGGSPDGVILGPNMTTLTYRLAETLSRSWRPGDEVVVSRLDHDANVRPWVQAAGRAGATVRWAEVDKSTAELGLDQYADLVSERTRLVAVTAASNIVGTRPDVAAVTAVAHAAGALTYVDGVHATPHMPVDVRALGADFYATSAYKWSGPHIGTVVADPALLDTLRPDKLVPAPDEVPGRFERGTAPFADLAGLTAAVEHLASLDPVATGSRRERVLASMAAVEAYEAQLFGGMLAGLAALPRVTLYGAAARRTPTAFFSVAGCPPAEVAAHLARARVNVWDGDNYAWELTGVLGLRSSGGAVRAGLVHYNDASDVDRLLTAIAALP